MQAELTTASRRSAAKRSQLESPGSRVPDADSENWPIEITSYTGRAEETLESSGAGRRLKSSWIGILSWAIAAFLILFAATGPWRLGGVNISRLSGALGVAVSVVTLWLAISPKSRIAAARDFLREDFYLSPWLVAAGGAAATTLVLLIIMNRYQGFEVNAWDFSFYDRSLADPFTRGFLFNDIENRSVLGTHAYFLLLLFLPLYAISPSPYWLLCGQAVLIGLAVAAAFYCLRRVSRDDLFAALLCAAFVLNPYTARAVQYVFHPEIFYPVALFLLMYGFLSERPVPFAFGLAATAAVKEDAVLPLIGLAITASLYYRRHRWAAAAAGVGLAFFLLDYHVVLPYFSGRHGPPWYSHYWAKYGSSPLAALLGMASHPVELARDCMGSGFWRLTGTLAFAPLAGYEFLLAATPMIVSYSAAAGSQLAQLRLYYSLPLLPYVFLAAGSGLTRLGSLGGNIPPGRRRARCRTGALAAVLVSAFVGPGYRLVRRQATDAPPRLAQLAVDRPLLVQGALLPHIGYSRNCSVLQPPVTIDGRHGFLIAPNAPAYPFSRNELQGLARRLVDDPRFRMTVDRGVILAVPAAWAMPHHSSGSARSPDRIRSSGWASVLNTTRSRSTVLSAAKSR
jgi:hypothetical protein